MCRNNNSDNDDDYRFLSIAGRIWSYSFNNETESTLTILLHAIFASILTHKFISFRRMCLPLILYILNVFSLHSDRCSFNYIILFTFCSTDLYCNWTWDYVLCWPPTRAGTTARQRCPSDKGIDPTSE